jgi:hypothetical protein
MYVVLVFNKNIHNGEFDPFDYLRFQAAGAGLL